jgi:uncharacterized membrane protein YeaQ/YmgE (transglycosylase-associated protein family)
MFSMVFWIAFGALVGWIAAILRDEHTKWGISTFITLGILGGITGGMGGLLLDSQAVIYQPSTADLMFAIFGASFFVLLGGMTVARRS